MPVNILRIKKLVELNGNQKFGEKKQHFLFFIVIYIYTIMVHILFYFVLDHFLIK